MVVWNYIHVSAILIGHLGPSLQTKEADQFITKT